MEWSWGTFFWGVILFFVFKAFLDRISNNSKVAKYEERIKRLETVVAAHTNSVDTLNNNQQILDRRTTDLTDRVSTAATHIDGIRRIIEGATAIQQRENRRRALGGGGGAGSVTIGPVAMGAGGSGGSASARPFGTLARPGEGITPNAGQVLRTEQMSGQVTHVAGDTLTIETDDLVFTATMQPDGQIRIDSREPKDQPATAPAPSGNGRRVINLEDE